MHVEISEILAKIHDSECDRKNDQFVCLIK